MERNIREDLGRANLGAPVPDIGAARGTIVPEQGFGCTAFDRELGRKAKACPAQAGTRSEVDDAIGR
jgi:hypothetical protein